MSIRNSVLRQALGDYQALRQFAAEDWPELVLVALKQNEERLDADEAAFERVIEALAADGNEGWARMRSGVVWTGAEHKPEYERDGPPLFAEWCEGPDVSLRLQPDPQKPGKLILRRFHEREPGSEGKANEGEMLFLRESRSLVAHPRRSPIVSLAYHVFWGTGDGEAPHALRRMFDRFVGFDFKAAEDEEENT